MASRIIEAFQDLEDPRKSNATRHDFAEMLTLAVIAVICGHETCVDMENFSRTHKDFLRTFLKLKHDIPSHDAFSRLFRILDPEAFEGVLLKLVDMFNHRSPDSAGRIDTSSLVRKFNQPPRKSSIYLLNVFGLSARIIFNRYRGPEQQSTPATDDIIPPGLLQFCTKTNQ
ncbi:MAG: ISAs1 family transposase [Synechococcus sp. SB0673_bin_10]|nr:ISAs1 family transposase [Synechococcus sp. SB0667_bin_8]MYG64186.1 ISAs1 family transposase [Synechococcus sp. SB0675_bin_7]MYI71946.1 ISAs1 family transposase [Synechococcus sp. SB0673_bin_10]MYK85153.1 ISAs1 family transposase [Synechococcus sp. SB0669_bin_7]